MSRRRRRRLIENGFGARLFKPRGIPLSELSGVSVREDGIEAMRLVDHLGLSQKEAGERMGISAPTLCRVLAAARAAVAWALSAGMAIRIEPADEVSAWGQPLGEPLDCRALDSFAMGQAGGAGDATREDCMRSERGRSGTRGCKRKNWTDGGQQGLPLGTDADQAPPADAEAAKGPSGGGGGRGGGPSRRRDGSCRNAE